MWTASPRRLLLIAALLDVVGQLVVLWLLISLPILLGLSPAELSLEKQWGWLIGSTTTYLLLSWLFGSYTVLRWRRVPLPSLLPRVFVAAVATVFVMAVFRWALNPGEQIWLLYRRVQLAWMLPVTIWSLLVRIGLGKGLLLPEAPALLVLGPEREAEIVMKAWQAIPARQPLQTTSFVALRQHLQSYELPSIVLTITPSQWIAAEADGLMEQLESCDPRKISLLSPLRLIETHQERLPTDLLPDSWLSYGEIPWTSAFNVQSQLKRAADVFVAAALLLVTAPFLLMAAVLVWLQDHGPVMYVQKRSGWLGQPFFVYKLRTMNVVSATEPARWTQISDQRITPIGRWLRRVRLDELPQLWNVLNGSMSLIGPRPERPEHEHELELRIPHYRKRHWMRPGLSGWAQVNAPYAASVEDSELKLSYDLYYLKHFSTWLDLLILLKTIKTVLKAGGR